VGKFYSIPWDLANDKINPFEFPPNVSSNKESFCICNFFSNGKKFRTFHFAYFKWKGNENTKEIEID
jgi:hypothetical protein